MAVKPTPTVAPPFEDRKVFTLAEANRALIYVRPIVHDVRDTYRQAIDIQQRLETPLPERDSRDLTESHDQAMGKLTHYVEELVEAGVELKDYELGLIDFPAILDGRQVLLCWKIGEEKIDHWHETDAGFTGRKPVADHAFDPPPPEVE